MIMRNFAILAFLAVLVVFAGSGFAQAPPPPPPSPAEAPNAAQSAAARPANAGDASSTASAPATPAKFEAADVHFTPPYRVPFYSGAFLRNGRYIIRQATMYHLIATAYGFKQTAYIDGGPTWVAWDRYDLMAKAPPGTTLETARLMLQNLLAERFRLVVHPGDVPVPAYLLSVAGGKPNLKQAGPGEESSCKTQPPSPPGPGSVPSIELVCHGTTLSSLVNTLEGMEGGGYLSYGTPVIDATGLKGTYDFDLKWTPKYFLPRTGSGGASIYQALEQQLGLKLELKTAMRPGIIVDSVNREPTPNSSDLAKIMPPLPPPQFEVATIRPTQPGEQPGGRIEGDEINFRGIPLKFLITMAWDLDPRNDDALVAPKWIESDRIDIHAKIAETDLGPNSAGRQLDFEQLRLMIRALVIERFQMKYHMEDRPIEAYTLVAVDPKLARADPKELTSCAEGHPGRDGKDPRLTNPMLTGLETCLNTSMEQFAEQLHRIAPDYFFYPAKDGTGLKGGWDFTISWSSPNLTQGSGANLGPAPEGASAPVVPTVSDPNGAVSFFDAIRKQLGLKIVKEKRPGPVLVIDQMNQQPTEN